MNCLRRIVTSCFLMFLSFSVLGQGIRFTQGTWADALAKARLESKMVFLDAMTAWCGPCKMMAKEVFTDSAVGAFFNANFVSIKLDMERGEGIELSNRYKVWVYPTLLFVDHTGAVQHRTAGFQSVQAFLALGKTALNPSTNLASLEHHYAAGNRRREFILEYLEAKTAAYDPDAGHIANEYLKSEDDLGTPENMDILLRHVDDPYSRGFRFLIQNRSEFEEKYGKREVKVKIETVFESYLQRHPGLQLGEVQRLYGTVYPERGEELASRYRLDYYRQKNDPENFARTAIDHYARYPSDDADELNEMAWLFAEEVTDPARLQTALAWVEKAISLYETHYTHYTHAKLLAKLGKKKAARSAAEHSLKLARAAGEDTLLVEEFLATLKRK